MIWTITKKAILTSLVEPALSDDADLVHAGLGVYGGRRAGWQGGWGRGSVEPRVRSGRRSVTQSSPGIMQINQG